MSWLHFTRIRSLVFITDLHLGIFHLRHLSQIRVPIPARLQICYARGEMITLRCAGIYVMPELSGIQSSNLGNCCIIQLSEDMSNHPFKPWAETASLGRAMAAKACPVFDAKKNVEWHTRLR